MSGWALLVLASISTVVVIGVAGLRQGSCPDPGECQVTVAGGPLGWFVIASFVLVVAWCVRRAVGASRKGRSGR